MLNLNDYNEHFCEYILFRYAWANEFVKEPFPENLYEYYDSFAKAYRYLIEKNRISGALLRSDNICRADPGTYSCKMQNEI